jgi:hypothetical protein
MADREAEQIKYETELLRLIFLLAVAMGGGSLSLLLGDPTPLRLILAGAGLLGTLTLLIVGWRQHHWIRALIAQIKEPL